MKKNDSILIGVVLCMAALLFLGLLLTRKEGGVVVVSIQGAVYGEYPLSEKLDIRIETESGIYNHLRIENGEADVIDASCPDLLCVHQRSIRYTKESIICLPNKFAVEIKKGTESEVDAVAQ